MVNFRINYVRKLHLLHFVSNCAQWEIYMGQSQNKYSLFHLFFQVLCIYYQPDLWLSGLDFRAPDQFLEGQWVEHMAEFCLFFFSNFQNSSNFQTFYFFFKFS